MADLCSIRASVWLGLILVPALTAGQPASLLLDINTAPYHADLQSGEISDLHATRSKVFFVAADQKTDSAGAEMWVSDGTSAGTEIVRDLCPGGCSEGPTLFGGLGDVMLWSASGADLDQLELWRSDGTRPGTFALTKPGINVRLDPSSPSTLNAFFHHSFYFVACSEAGNDRDCDLWRTDGSLAGTEVFQAAPHNFSWLLVAGDRLYYVDWDSQGSNLWVTDGTVAGTTRLRRFDGASNIPAMPVSAGGRIFFIAQAEGSEVWTSDGTVAGTRALTSLAPDEPFSSSGLMPRGNRVYFVANDGQHGFELWRTDGTPAGTVRLTDLPGNDPEDHPFPEFSGPDSPSFFVELGDTVLFEAITTDVRVWTTRGTPASTARLAVPCTTCDIDVYTGLVELGGEVYFKDAPGTSNPASWVTDGTAAGTHKVEGPCPGCFELTRLPWQGGVLFPYNGQIWFNNGTRTGTKPFTRLVGAQAGGAFNAPFEVVEMNGDAYFLAEGANHWESQGLWVRTAHGDTRPVFALPVNVSTSDPQHLTPLGNRLLFQAWDGQHSDLWTSSGTAETTSRLGLPDSLPCCVDGEPIPAAGLLFFQSSFGEQPELWRTDGTNQGTFPVAPLEGRIVMAPFQGALYFFNGQGIWKTDGTPQGTLKTGDLPADHSVDVAVPGPHGIFLRTETSSGPELWLTDGTSAGTQQLTSNDGTENPQLGPEFTVVGSSVYFIWGGFLWKTDGTPAATSKLDGLPLDGRPIHLVAFQGALYLFTGEFSSQLRLWRTDGTSAGTAQLGQFLNTFNFPLTLTPAAGKLFFNVDDGVHGIELWATDGTAAGTALVKDLFPGPRSSKPTQLMAAGGRLFFSAGEDLHGIELWQSDGTADGTRMVQDIGPQAASSDPEQLTAAGDKLYFTANDGVTGREVWVLPLPGSPACQPSPTRLCLSGGRYAVEAAWRDFAGNRGVGQAVPLTADTGAFWFFDPANVETVLKVLDGRGVNSHVWVFYGALSNVEYTLTVTDTATGLEHRYVNPARQLASVADTHAFGPLGATEEAAKATTVAAPSPLAQVSRRSSPAAATGTCIPSSTRLCLNGARFAVEISWRDFQGHTGQGQAVGITGDTGWFWFFDAANVEVILKVLDGRPVNNHWWVFYGALSNVEYKVTVTDTVTGEIATYSNPSGQLASVADTVAF